jgi:DNA-binding GntR family transcriptional regulator
MSDRKSSSPKASRLSESKRFLYGSVSKALRDRLATGTYEPGERLPTVEQLAVEFGVSTITVRRAVRDLSLEGLLIGRQGLGLFVANKMRIVRRLTADHIAPIEEDMRRAGVEPGLEDIDMTLVPAHGEPFLRPHARVGSTLYRLSRILLADEEPVGLDTLWLPRALGDALKPELPGHFVMPLLAAHGVAIDHIDYRFDAATATEAQAAPLNVVTGFPLLVIHFTPLGTTGTPLLWGRTTTRADRFTYEFCGHPEAHHRRSGRAQQAGRSHQ